MSIDVFAKWQVKEGALSTVLSLLPELAQKSREEPGNLFYNIFQSTTEQRVIILHESYTSEEAIETHRNSAHFREIAVGKIVPLLENREVILTVALSH